MNKLMNSAKYRLLVVDDEAPVRILMERLFSDRFEVKTAEDGTEGLAIAEVFKPHVVISDQRMPLMTGVEFLERIREILPDTGRILVSAYADYGVLVDAVNAASIHHYMEKPFHNVKLKLLVDSVLREQLLKQERIELLEELKVTVSSLEDANRQISRHEQELSRLVYERTEELTAANEELAASNSRLQESVVRDGLTGLFNRQYMREYIEIEVARSMRYQRSFTLLFLDIDHFKNVNDSYGHQVGDRTLVAIAKLLSPTEKQFRKSDFAARYGGEEFVIVLPETDIKGAMIKAERIRSSVEASDWTKVHPELPPITISIGIATYPEDGDTGEEILDVADQRLYAAKGAGRNRVISVTPPPDA